MNAIICGNHIYKKKKPCKCCKYFILWGISVGYCLNHHEDKMYGEHCKYYKRDSEYWTKDGKCKLEALLKVNIKGSNNQVLLNMKG